MLPRSSELPEKRDGRPKPAPRRPVVSVCIVNWNCRTLLKACLRSLSPKRQRLRLEIIVVDNGSTDGAPEMVERDFPHVRLVRNAENAGFARANNQAARLARGRRLFFLNNDTRVPPGALRELIDYLGANPQVALVGPRLRVPGGGTQSSWRRKPTVAALLHRTCVLGWTGLFRDAHRRYRGREAVPDEPRPVECLLGAALLARRKAFRECGGWDEAYTFGAEDIDLCVRIADRGAVVYHSGVEIIHHGRAGSRRNIEYVYPHTAAGMARSLRKCGASPLSLFFYKAALTLDAPVQWLRHAIRYAMQRARGNPAAAEKSRLTLRGVGRLLTRGLPGLWRA